MVVKKHKKPLNKPSVAPPKHVSGVDPLRTLEEWFKEHDVSYDEYAIKLVLNLRGSGGKTQHAMGVVAVRDLRVGETVCRISKEAILSPKTTAIADILEQHDLSIGVLGLTVALAFEMSLGEKSPFFGYLSTLPERENLPIFWSEAELEELKGTDLGEAVLRDKALLIDDFETHVVPMCKEHPDLLPPSKITCDLFLRAASLVASRAFQVDAFHGDSMVPLADTFNHKTNAEIVHFESEGDVCPTCGSFYECDCNDDDDDNASVSSSCPSLADSMSSIPAVDDSMYLEMTTIRRCRKGDEVYNTYGVHGNGALLGRYGFCEVGNAEEGVSVEVEEVA
ncbi:hypothetical protein HK104_010721, partial [Borealophlyctis nickersoniae]